MNQKLLITGLMVVIVTSAAVVGLSLYPRTATINQPGRPCCLVCPAGHNKNSTWGHVFSLPDSGRRMGDDGVLQVRCPECKEWAKVLDPAPTSRD